MNRLVDMLEIDVVGVVKAQPLSLSRQGKSRIKRHLQKVGARLLRRVIRRLQSGQPARMAPAEMEASHDDYYPMPGDSEFASYVEEHRFFRIRDVLGLIAFRGLRR